MLNLTEKRASQHVCRLVGFGHPSAVVLEKWRCCPKPFSVQHVAFSLQKQRQQTWCQALLASLLEANSDAFRISMLQTDWTAVVSCCTTLQTAPGHTHLYPHKFAWVNSEAHGHCHQWQQVVRRKWLIDSGLSITRRCTASRGDVKTLSWPGISVGRHSTCM